MMKNVRFHLIPSVLILCLFLSGTALADAAAHVYDDAGLFSGAESEQIASELQTLQDETGMAFVVATTDDVEGKNAQEYADDFYESCGAASAENNYSGMLYLIDMDNREIFISTEGDMIRYLTDDRIDALLDDAYEEVVDGNYAASALAVLRGTGTYIEAGIPDDQYNYSSETGEVDPYRKKGFPVLALVFGMIAGLAAALINFFRVKSSYHLTKETYHYPLVDKSKMNLTVKEDRLINSIVTHRKIPKNPPPSSGGSSGRSTTHRSSSGRTHGGGSRKF